MGDKQFLNQKQKLELIAATLLATTMLLTYTIHGLLNGFTWTNHLLQKNIIPVIWFILLLFGFIPVYSKHDDILIQIFKKASWTWLISLSAAFIWIYYFFAEPSTGLQKLAHRLSYLIVGYSVISFAAMIYTGAKLNQ